MNKFDELRELLIMWAEKNYFPLLDERNRYRETAQKYLLKCRKQEQEIRILKFKLEEERSTSKYVNR